MKHLGYLSLLFLALLYPVRAEAWLIGTDSLRRTSLERGVLCDQNLQKEQEVFNLTETEIAPGSGYRPSLSLDLSGARIPKGKEKPVWGVVWGYSNRENFHALLLCDGESGFYEYSLPELRFKILTVCGNDTTVHTEWTTASSSAIGVEGSYNRLHIAPVSGGYELFLGADREYRIGFCPDDRQFGSLAGIWIGGGTQVRMRNWKVDPAEYIERNVFWDLKTINNYLARSANAPEGFYEYSTSASTNDNVRLGGYYQVALIRSGNGFLLLYLDGAQRLADQWKPGMIKAALLETGVEGMFDVIWYDAGHRPLRNGNKATISPNRTITLYFTEEGARIVLTPTLRPREKNAGNNTFRHV